MANVLITGIFGQDGFYLSELLLSKGYNVIGTYRTLPTVYNKKIILEKGDITNTQFINKIFKKYKFDYCYNLAAQSNVKKSFDEPVLTGIINGISVVNILEAIKNISPSCKLFQASTAELFGNATNPQNENTPFNPINPYGISKKYAQDMCKLYRNVYDLHISTGLLYPHESPIRNPAFVTRKITSTIGRIYKGSDEVLELGNLNSERDRSHAKDVVNAMYLIINHDIPLDWVVGSGKSFTIRDFCKKAFKHINIDIVFDGINENEIGIDKNTGKILIKINPIFYRPIDTNLVSNPIKIKTELGWYPQYTIDDLIKEMIDFDKL